MSEDIRINVIRAGNPIASNVSVQLDKMEAQEAAFFEGSDPHFTYDAYTTSLPVSDPQLIQQDDHLVDQVVIDAVTGTNRVFRIIADPEVFPLDNHWEFTAVRYRGPN